MVDVTAPPSVDLAADAFIFEAGAAPRPHDQTPSAGRRPALFALAGPLQSGRTEVELEAAIGADFAGALLAGATSGADLQHLGAILAVVEARLGLQDGSLGIVARLDCAASFLSLASFVGASPRLRAIAWDGEKLARDLGARAARTADGRWSEPCSVARFQTLAAARAAGVPAIDAPFFGAAHDAFEREAATAAAEGFGAKFALSDEQTGSINRLFSAA